MRLPWFPLVLLSAGIFAAVTSEFLPIGLLPQLVADLGITEPQVGLLVTVFAATVVALTVLVDIVLPPVEHRVAYEATTSRMRFAAARDKTFAPVMALCATVALVTLGHATFSTHIAPWVIDEAGFAEPAVAGVLLVFGAAGAVGIVAASAAVPCLAVWSLAHGRWRRFRQLPSGASRPGYF